MGDANHNADRAAHKDLLDQLKKADANTMTGALVEIVEHLLGHIEHLEERVSQLEGSSTSVPFPES